MSVSGSGKRNGVQLQRLDLKMILLLSVLFAHLFIAIEGSTTRRFWVTTTYYRQKTPLSDNNFNTWPGYSNSVPSNGAPYSTITRYWSSNSRQTTSWSSKSRQPANSNYIPGQSTSTLRPSYASSSGRHPGTSEYSTSWMNANSGHTISVLTVQNSQPPSRQTQTLNYNTNTAQRTQFNPSLSTFRSSYAQPSSTPNANSQSSSFLRTSKNSAQTTELGYTRMSQTSNSNFIPSIMTRFSSTGSAIHSQYPTSRQSTSSPYMTRRSSRVTGATSSMAQGSISARTTYQPMTSTANPRTIWSTFKNKITETAIGRITSQPTTVRGWPMAIRTTSTQKPDSYPASNRYTNNQQYTISGLFTNFPLWQGLFTTNKH